MIRLKKKIEEVMLGEGKGHSPVLTSLLYLVSIIYGAAHSLRRSCYQQKLLPSRQLPCKVISVGNITVGGTGKTPMTILVAEKLKQAGYSVTILSRGYKGHAENYGGIVSDGRKIYMDSEQSGDEPYLIAWRLSNIPVIVGKNRFAAGMMAVSKFKPDVIVLDDGFQHLKLNRNIDLVLLDYRNPFGNSHLLPRGTLREPISSLARSTVCILTRYSPGDNEVEPSSLAALKKVLPGCPLFKSSHLPYCYKIKTQDAFTSPGFSDFLTPNDVDEIRNKKVFAFSGIARNDDFRQTVIDFGFNATGFLEFPDHHNYTRQDLDFILDSARNAGARLLITTEKDHVRIARKKALPLDLIVVGVKITFGEKQQDFIDFIVERLENA